MQLKVHFRNVTRSKDAQVQIDCAFRDYLLHLCNGVETAQKLQDQFNRNPRDPYSDWRRFYISSFNHATKKLSDKEREKIVVDLRFVN